MTAVHIMEQVFVITFTWLTWYNGMLNLVQAAITTRPGHCKLRNGRRRFCTGWRQSLL